MTPIEMRRRAIQMLDDLRQASTSDKARDVLTAAEQLLLAAEELEEMSGSGTAGPAAY